ncbi:MAG: hypothetical protein OEZ36_04415 [Spirochaetota bacterium]|nr:hypothetical protein [Spirochaetota bacterium]
MKKNTEIVIASALVLFMVYLIYDSLYELIAYRFSIENNRLIYSLNISTVTHIIILLASISGLVPAVLIVKHNLKKPDKRTFPHWIALIICVIIIKLSWCVWAANFFNTAFDVG